MKKGEIFRMRWSLPMQVFVFGLTVLSVVSFSVPAFAAPDIDGTGSDVWILDHNNDTTEDQIILQFGDTLAKILQYSIANLRFEFNDDVHVDGDVEITGSLEVDGSPVDTTKDVNTLYINRNSSSASYATIGEFIYSGTSVEGAISAFYATLSVDSGATSYEARIYDVTNAQVIAEMTGQTNTTQQIKDYGTVSNLPSGQALFQIQVKRVGGLLQLVRFGSLQYRH